MDFKRTQEDLERQKSLNDRLEQDLLQIHKPNGMGHESPSNMTKENSSSLNLAPDSNTEDVTAASAQQFTPSAEISILPIVTSQRDRFRQRNTELEEVSTESRAMASLPTSNMNRNYASKST
jgi:homeobox protein cut-like